MSVQPIRVGGVVAPITKAGLELYKRCPTGYSSSPGTGCVFTGTGTVLERRKILFEYPDDDLYEGMKLHIWFYKIKCSTGVGWGSGVERA